MLTIRELIKTLYNALTQRMKKYRGNWEQNDPTADDYIKNRPFYTDENKTITIIPEQNVTFSSEYGASSTVGFANISLSPIIELVAGQEYDVVWDEKKYKCIAYEFDGLAVIGSNFMTNGFDNEPFFIAVDREFFGGAYITTEDTNSHTVGVTTKDIKKLDKKYLPDLGLADVAYSGNYWDLEDTPTIYSDVVRYGTSQSLTTANKTQARTNIGAVGYESQSLTDSQKTQVRTNIGAASSSEVANVVKYTAQSLSTTQKAQARTNIGAGTSSFSGSYNDLTNKPTIYTDVVQYNVTQVLNDTQQRRARTNIGAGTSSFDGKFSSLTESPLIELNITEEEQVYNQLTRFHQLVKYDANGSFVLCNDGELPFGCYVGDISSNGKNYHSIAAINNLRPRYLFCADGTEGLIVGETYGFVSAGLGIRRSKPYEKVYRTLRVVEVCDENYARLIDDSATIIPSNVPFIQSAQVGQTLAVKSVDENGKPTEWETVDGLKDTISLVDQVNGYTYIACMRNGNFVTYCAAKSIKVATIPTKTEYMAGEYFDPTGMVVTATCYDGTTREVTGCTYPTVYLAEGATSVEITYVEDGTTHTATVPVTVIPFDPAVVLVDFEYTANEDGTYTITGWKETYNGEASTEIIIPNNGLIMV